MSDDFMLDTDDLQQPGGECGTAAAACHRPAIIGIRQNPDGGRAIGPEYHHHRLDQHR